MIDFQNILFVIFGDQNIDAADGHADRFEGFFCQSYGGPTWFKEFDGAAEREVGPKIAFSGDAAHAKNFLANNQQSQVVNIGNKLLDDKTFGGFFFFDGLAGKSKELFFVFDLDHTDALAGTRWFDDDGIGEITGERDEVTVVMAVTGVGDADAGQGELHQVGNFVDRVI